MNTQKLLRQLRKVSAFISSTTADEETGWRDFFDPKEAAGGKEYAYLVIRITLVEDR